MGAPTRGPIVIVRLRRGRRVHEVQISEGDAGDRLKIDGRPFAADIVRTADGYYSVLCDGSSFEVAVLPDAGGWRVETGGRVYRVRPDSGAAGAAAAGGASREVRSTLPGKIVQIQVEAGDEVKRGDPLVIIEAMKMENELRAPFDARVERLVVSPGQAVESGALLMVLAPLGAEPEA
jgi:biotin carboxyl carrier protein